MVTLHASEIVRIIGKRQTKATYDSVCIIPRNAKFQFSDPPIAIPIPSTTSSAGIDTKLVPLRRVTMKVTISGELVDGTDGYSFTGVTLNDGTGAVTGGAAVTSILKKSGFLRKCSNRVHLAKE